MLKISRWLMVAAMGAMAASGQRPPEKTNPLGSSEEIIAAGRAIYNRSCTACHGLNGTAGGRGPALAGGRGYVRSSDASIFETIQDGIRGTEMPPSSLAPDDIWKVVAYIRSLRASASDAFVPGDAAHGEQIFWGKGRCGECHMIAGRGGILGPDLSSIGAQRTLREIRDALTKARRRVPDGYAPVEIVAADGRRFSGIVKNEDNFSLQLLDSRERLQLFARDELREIRYKDASLMPRNYDRALTAAEFQDLLAFLSRQARDREQRRRESEDGQP
jgi:cytochrome c oxidase cbb3-type subunit 3